MIRFILRRKRGLICGLQTEDLYTIDYAFPELERALKSGGHGESQYDYTELVGVELTDEPPPNSPSRESE